MTKLDPLPWTYLVFLKIKRMFWSDCLKDQIILATEQGILADFWVPHEIESCNFQNLHVFRFPETSQNLITFSQLLFSLFQMGNPLKKSKKPRNLPKLPRPVAKMIWSLCSLEITNWHIVKKMADTVHNLFIFQIKIISDFSFLF